MKGIKDKECRKDIRYCLWITLTESSAMITKQIKEFAWMDLFN